MQNLLVLSPIKKEGGPVETMDHQQNFFMYHVWNIRKLTEMQFCSGKAWMVFAVSVHTCHGQFHRKYAEYSIIKM